MSDYAANTHCASLDRWVMLMASVMRGTEFTHYNDEMNARAR